MAYKGTVCAVPFFCPVFAKSLCLLKIKNYSFDFQLSVTYC